jgi:hypothetical protein
MKKIILLLLCLTFFSVNAQKITKKFLVGKWTSESTEMVFSIENKKDFKIVCYSTLSGNYLKVTDYQFDKGSFYLETLILQERNEEFLFLIQEKQGDLP